MAERGQKDKGKMQDYLRVPWLNGFFTLTLMTIDTLKLVGWLVCECQRYGDRKTHCVIYGLKGKSCMGVVGWV